MALGISFGVVLGKEVFNSTGKNFINPALAGRAFLFFAYPAFISGDAVWNVVDGYAGATGQLREHFGDRLDGIVHSIAFANPERALGGAFLNTEWKDVGISQIGRAHV